MTPTVLHLACALALATLASPASAQTRTGGGFGTSGGGFGGSGGGFGGSGGFGSSGSGFSGGGFGLSGGSGFGLSGGQGSGTGAFQSRGTNLARPGTAGQGVSPTNAFSIYYANPLYQGSPANTTGEPGGFGEPTFGQVTTTTGTAGTAGALGGTGTASVTVRVAPGSKGFTAPPVLNPARRPVVAAALGFRTPRVAPAELRADVHATLLRSERLPSSGRIQVTVQGRDVLLTGDVADERERRLAEAVVRLTPGVGAIVNELRPLNPDPDPDNP